MFLKNVATRGTFFEKAATSPNDMKYFIAFALFLAGAALLRAQDQSATPIDGPVIKTDSLKRQPVFVPQLITPPASANEPIFKPMDIPVYESKEQRALRTAERVRAQMMPSLLRNMAWLRAAMTPSFFRPTPMGYVPLQSSNPNIMAKEPGFYPYDNPASPVNIPQTIRTEYDFATGKYKMVPIPWEEYSQYQFNRFNPSNFNNAPVPQVNLTPGDQIMRR